MSHDRTEQRVTFWLLTICVVLMGVLLLYLGRDRVALDFLEREHMTVFYFDQEEHAGEDPYQVMRWMPDTRFNTGGTYSQLGSGQTLRAAIHQARKVALR